MKTAQKRELIKNGTGLLVIILAGVAYSYSGSLFKSNIDPQVSAEAARAMNEQTDCSQKALGEYLKPSMQLSQDEDELRKAGKSTADVVIAERRLKERQCLQEATCEYIETNKQHNQMMFDADFNSCLDDYKEDTADPPSTD